MSLRPYHWLCPVQRGSPSLFDIGLWSDPHRDMWSRMGDMERQMDRMFRDFTQLQPNEFFSFPEVESQRMENPYVTDKDGNRKLQLRFDVRQFKPEEIQVKTEDGHLSVHARHESKTDNSRVFQEYHRHFSLPSGLDAQKLSSVLSPEGVLTVEAPMPAIEAPPKQKEVAIPIQHK